MYWCYSSSKNTILYRQYSVNDNARTDVATESNLSGEDESSDDNFETNQHNNSENNDDFVSTNHEPSSSKGANETGVSGVNKRKRKSDNIIPKFIQIIKEHIQRRNYQFLKEI